jgi:membrane peptidoglycan carboxypeptidase
MARSRSSIVPSRARIPGSTFKVVTMLAGLRQGLVTASSHEAQGCSGGYFYGGRRFGCWKHDGHGNLDLVTALQQSCDVFFYQLGLRMGLDPLQATARDCGLGERTGIDLPGETRGLVPTNAYYDERFHTGSWPRGVLLNLGIGQGELLATPLQLATMAAVVAGRAASPSGRMSSGSIARTVRSRWRSPWRAVSTPRPRTGMRCIWPCARSSRAAPPTRCASPA